MKFNISLDGRTILGFYIACSDDGVKVFTYACVVSKVQIL